MAIARFNGRDGLWKNPSIQRLFTREGLRVLSACLDEATRCGRPQAATATVGRKNSVVRCCVCQALQIEVGETGPLKPGWGAGQGRLGSALPCSAL